MDNNTTERREKSIATFSYKKNPERNQNFRAHSLQLNTAEIFQTNEIARFLLFVLSFVKLRNF